jgi:hypothetical protein
LVGRSVVAAGISFLLGLGAVTALEHSAGKSLTCWVWEECPVQSSDDVDGGRAGQSTQPSIFGGGPSASSGTTPGVRPAGTQQRPAPTSVNLEAPSSQTPSKAAGSEGFYAGAGDRRREQSEQQQGSYYYSSEEYEQQTSSPDSTMEESQRQEYRDSDSAGRGEKTSGEYGVPPVPWST